MAVVEIILPPTATLLLLACVWLGVWVHILRNRIQVLERANKKNWADSKESQNNFVQTMDRITGIKNSIDYAIENLKKAKDL